MSRLLAALLLLLGLGGNGRAAEAPCVTLERVTAAAFTDYTVWIADEDSTLVEVGCYCQGTCSTAAEWNFKDHLGNLIELVGADDLPCTVGSAVTTWVATDAADTDRDLNDGERLMVSVAATPTPTSVDRVTICMRFTFP